MEQYPQILNDKIDGEGVAPDRATERAGQICYLPNRGEYYEHHIQLNGGPLDPTRWAKEIQAEKARLKAAEEAARRRQEEARAKARKRIESGGKSPVDAYNESYDLEMVLASYGYIQKGWRWLSPNSSSGAPGVTITKDGRKWLSTHGSDSVIGMSTANGTLGDAFDLFTHYGHRGDRNAAIKAASAIFGLRWEQPREQKAKAAKKKSRGAMNSEEKQEGAAANIDAIKCLSANEATDRDDFQAKLDRVLALDDVAYEFKRGKLSKDLGMRIPFMDSHRKKTDRNRTPPEVVMLSSRTDLGRNRSMVMR